MTQLTQNGISTTTGLNSFRYEKFTSQISARKTVMRVQWDYRDRSGQLHTGMAGSVEQAKEQAKQYGYEG